MLKRQTGCPLCGAKPMARDWLGASTGLLDAELGVLAARCRYCQGYLELRPLAGRVDIGYLVGKGNVRFEVALTLPYASFNDAVERVSSCPDRAVSHMEYQGSNSH